MAKSKATKQRSRSWTNRKGRNENYANFIWFDRYILRSEAWRKLNGTSAKVLINLMARYKGDKNGDISYSAREAADECGITKTTANIALRDIEDKGFTECMDRGAFTVKHKEASTWRLTMYPCDGNPATKEFMRPEAPPKAPRKFKTRYRNSVSTVSKIGTDEYSDTAHGIENRDRDPQNDPIHGIENRYTYSFTIPPSVNGAAPAPDEPPGETPAPAPAAPPTEPRTDIRTPEFGDTLPPIPSFLERRKKTAGAQ